MIYSNGTGRFGNSFHAPNRRFPPIFRTAFPRAEPVPSGIAPGADPVPDRTADPAESLKYSLELTANDDPALEAVPATITLTNTGPGSMYVWNRDCPRGYGGFEFTFTGNGRSYSVREPVKTSTDQTPIPLKLRSGESQVIRLDDIRFHLAGVIPAGTYDVFRSGFVLRQ